MTDELFSENETAPILRVTAKCLQSWRAQKRGPAFVRVGRRIFYPKGAIQAFLTRNLVETQDSVEAPAEGDETS
jgi:hypothetical protein